MNRPNPISIDPGSPGSGRPQTTTVRAAASRAWLGLTLSVAVAASAYAADYTYVKVGDPARIGGYPYGMDNQGRVVTTSLVRSFLFADNFHASYVEITNVNVATSTPGMLAQGINDLGEVVGRYRTNGLPANQTRGFVRRADGTFEPFDYPGVASTAIADINNLGHMVGETRSDLTAFGLTRGFVHTNGVSAEIHFPGAVLSRAFGINDAGDIVGQYQLEDSLSRPFLLRNGAYSEIVPTGSPDGLVSAIAYNISDNGMILGTYRNTNNVTKTWVMSASGTFSYPELPGSGRTINNAGQISGTYNDATNSNVATAFVATPKSEVNFLVHRFALTNSASATANKINDLGQITGTVDGTDGVSRGYRFDTATGQEVERAGYPGSAFTEWGGITSSGTLAGYYADPADPNFGTYRAFTRDSSGNYTPIIWSGDSNFCFTVDIDEHGRVAGGGNNTAWVWNTNGTFNVFNVPGFTVNGAFGMNDHGLVVGAAWPGFFDTPNGLIYNISNSTATIWNYPAAAQTTLYGINNRGDIVGEYKPNLTSANIPFVRWADGSTQVLSFPGLSGVRVYDINDARMIVGRYKDAANKNRSFYATPYRFETARRYTDGHADVRMRYKGGALWVGYNLTSEALVDGQYAGDDAEHHETGVDFPITALKSVIPDMPFPRPDGSEWDFLGAAAGEPLWFIPEVQERGKPWLGFSSEELNFGEWAADALKVQLIRFSGPSGAQFTMFDSGADGGGAGAHIHMATADGIDANDQYQYQSGVGPVQGFRVSTHAHINWVFTKRGRYEITFKISGTHLVDGPKESTVVLVFDVAPPADPAFTFAPFNIAGATSTLLSDIRNDGALVGRYIDSSGISQGFVKHGTDLTTFNVTGTTATFPGGLDNFGRIAGFYRDVANPEIQHGFIRQTNGTITTIDIPGQTFTYAWRINDVGQVNGYWFEDPFFIRSFRRATDGTLTTNLFTGSPVGTVTRGMNEAGETAGWKWDDNFKLQGVLFAAGQTNVFTVLGWEHTLPGDINNLGDIAGTVNNGFTNTAGFFRRADGATVTFTPPGAVEVEVFGLNDLGQVVGEYVTAGGGRHGFIAHPAVNLERGHTDVGIAFENGAFDLHIHDEEHDIEYGPDDAVLAVGIYAEQYIPDTAAFSFLGRPGHSTWTLPAIQDESLLFLGFGAEEIESGVFVGDALRMELVSVEGAGDFFVFTLDQFGNPIVHINSADGISASDFMPLLAGGHQHVNWGFSAAGTYRIGLRARGTLVNGNQPVVSQVAYYTFTVPAARYEQPIEPDDSFVYNVIDLGTFGGTAFANALGVNNAGVVVGGANFPDNNTFHPYRFSGVGPKQDLGTAGGDIAGANDINEAGEITGTTFLVPGSGDSYLPFRYTTTGVMQVITNILGGLNGEAAAINEAGRIVGSAEIARGQFETVAFYADADNVMHSLGTFGGTESRAENINDAGYIVGNAQLANGERRAFRHWGNGPLNPATDDLGTLGGNRSQAHAINAAGKVTGTSRIVGNASSPAFLWQEGVGMTNLGTLGSGTLAYGFAINSNDVVVGWSLTVSNDFDSSEAFIWDRQHGMRNLNDLVPRGLGLLIDGAYSINDQGWIAGTAKRLSDGAATPVLLKPAKRLKTGDTDIGIAFENGAFDLHVHAETIDQEFAPGAALLHAAATTYGTVPTNAAYAFLGAAGAPVWTLSAVEDPRQLFLGIAAEEIESGLFVSNQIKLTLTSVNGPGHIALYTVDGFGVPHVSMNTRDGIDSSDAVIAIAGSHQHYNWGFSAPGVYRVRVKASGTLVAGSQFVESEEVEYLFEVIGIETHLAIDRTGDNGTVSFVTQDGLTYQLESAPAVTGPWANEGASFLGTGRMKHITVPLDSGAQFFRMKAETGN